MKQIINVSSVFCWLFTPRSDSLILSDYSIDWLALRLVQLETKQLMDSFANSLLTVELSLHCRVAPPAGCV